MGCARWRLIVRNVFLNCSDLFNCFYCICEFNGGIFYFLCVLVVR